MGLLIKDNIETELGSSNKIYGRITNLRVEKHFGTLEVVFTYYNNKKDAYNIGNLYFSQEATTWNGSPISGNIKSGSADILLPSFYILPLTSSKELNIPKTIIVSRSISTIDFDENGNQIEINSIVSESIQTSSIELREDAISLGVINNDMYTFIYNIVKADIQKCLPNSTIEDC